MTAVPNHSTQEGGVRWLQVPALGANALIPELEASVTQGDWVWLQASATSAAWEAAAEAFARLDRPQGGGVLLASGGSQGERSLCLLPWSHLDRSAVACGHWLQRSGLDPATLLLLNPLPMHHVSGLMPWWRSRLWGADHQPLSPALMKQPADLLDACGALASWGQRPAVVSLVPTQLKRLLDRPEGVAWLQQLALVWVGGAGLPAPLADQARKLRLPLAPCYGATETVAMVAAQTPAEFLAGEPGCGQPLEDVELQVQGDGTLLVRTERLALARWRDGQWAPLVDAEGWWRTGDAAELCCGADGSQQLLIRGRLDGAIHSGGETVFPEQLEQRLRDQAKAQGLALDAVLMLAVESAEWGQRLVALVRPSLDQGDAPEWCALQRSLQAITATWPPAEQPLRWCCCPALGPSETGKWERGRWRQWLARRDSSSRKLSGF